MVINPVAYARTPYPTKFGVPRQPGLVDALTSDIVFEPDYSNPDFLRGIEGFDRLWIIWAFSQNLDADGAPERISPTVRPPRIGGTQRVGVFATRSSFRPNGLAISCVENAGWHAESPARLILSVRGADLVDGTPVFDIKPYLAYADAHPDASLGWTAQAPWPAIERIDFPPDLLRLVPTHLREGLIQVLKQDPRPAYARSEGDRTSDREFWVPLESIICRFVVRGGILTVTKVETMTEAERDELAKTGSLQRLHKHIR